MTDKNTYLCLLKAEARSTLHYESEHSPISFKKKLTSTIESIKIDRF